METKKDKEKQQVIDKDLAAANTEDDTLQLDTDDEMEDLVDSIEEKERSMKKKE